jgi:Reverse transcriptase (RNA-dependent DNA polymerase)
VSKDIFNLVQAFYNNRLDLTKLNHACIILIPKIAEANEIKQFRTISLINYSFKIITKILASRLATVVDHLIGPTQTAFIKGRNITANIVSAQEILYQVRKTKEKSILFKIDFEKVFDKVNWKILIEILKLRDFGVTWIKWIIKILENGQTCININNNLTPYFKCKK